MKKAHAWLVLGTLIALLSTLAFGISYSLHCDWASNSAIKRGDVYGWMKHEFHLSDAQVAKIKALDDSYVPVCDKHCQDIGQAEAALGKAKTPKEKAELSTKIEQLKGVCRKGLEEHLRVVASVMPKEQGERYYSMMKEHLECMNSMGVQHSINSSK